MSRGETSSIDVVNEWQEQVPRLQLFRLAKELTNTYFKPAEGWTKPEFYTESGEAVFVRDWHIEVALLQDSDELKAMDIEDIGIVHSPKMYYQNVVHPEGLLVVIKKGTEADTPISGLSLHLADQELNHVDVDYEGHRRDGGIDYRPALDSDISEVRKVLDTLAAIQGR